MYQILLCSRFSQEITNFSKILLISFQNNLYYVCCLFPLMTLTGSLLNLILCMQYNRSTDLCFNISAIFLYLSVGVPTHTPQTLKFTNSFSRSYQTYIYYQFCLAEHLHFGKFPSYFCIFVQHYVLSFHKYKYGRVFSPYALLGINLVQ